ncbi:YigZ family protein [Nonlabens spongiae]|uniref:YigZ family protein n=1 Tax=Nonlabens spongiae TaxID=331648 RepID=A0A1W6MNJ7_9FLAO|nr:YigZ family protein [Nonlabens spongiae]ARN79180.1 YigZ family protein [Nonlabens spongiae]
MTDSYKTLEKNTEEILFKDKGSKFYATAFPLSDPEDMNEILSELNKKHPKAGHHCYAWKIGSGDDNYRINDDGEPRNSAGATIYGQIQSYELSDVAVVVSRIFGGTKLGVSGLINAYKTSAALALDKAEIITKVITEDIIVQFEYPQMSQIMRWIDENGLLIKKQNLTASCEMVISVPQSKVQEHIELLNSWHPIIAKENI